jgi:acetyl-CoA synthetase
MVNRLNSENKIISLEGNRIKKIKSEASSNPEQFWSECAKNLIWF